MEINASANTVGIENAINLSNSGVDVTTANHNSPFPAKINPDMPNVQIGNILSKAGSVEVVDNTATDMNGSPD